MQPHANGTEMVTRPTLHIEARVKNDEDIIVRTDIIRDEVTKWLLETFAVLSLGQEITSFADMDVGQAHYLDVIKVMECVGQQQESGAYRLEEVELNVQAYQLRGSDVADDNSQQTYAAANGKSDEDGPQARIISLPSKELDGMWESLLFDELIPSTLLRAVSRMLVFSWTKLNTWTINWNRLILLYGPPGTGKTSLCRGLAQKLSIRLGKQFAQSKMVEINAHSLGSKYFSESGKLVARMFDNIENMLEEEPDTFTCVFIDEVETLTAKREKSIQGNEPFDAMRAVNAILTALDRLRHRPNVVVLCTSNLTTALDSAFLDRVDIKQFIPYPTSRVIYEIYRSCLENLSECGLIHGSTFDVIRVEQDNPATELKYVSCPAETLVLPSHTELVLWYQLFPESIPKQLADVAEASVGLSGRSLRRLPVLSLVLHTDHASCSIEQAVRALARGVEEEKRATAEAGESSSPISARPTKFLFPCSLLEFLYTTPSAAALIHPRQPPSPPLLSSAANSLPLSLHCGGNSTLWKHVRQIHCAQCARQSHLPSDFPTNNGMPGHPPQSFQNTSLTAIDCPARDSSTTSGSRVESPFYLTLSASAATVTAVGAVAWYYHLYGEEAFAMTPAEEGLHPAKYPWEHTKWTKTFDHQALRRGFQVYREVCMACHSLTRVPWRAFVGTIHTVDEMKAMAEEYEYDTEPNDQGEIEKRPGKLSDYIPPPYKNEEAARAANNSALPPDLSLMVKARHGGCDYIFSLLTGYPDEPPAGATVQEGLSFNPYFPGTGIAMARVLFDGLVEYEDGTPATTSQMAKDVTEFLNWTAEPEMDERKKMGLKTLAITAMLTAISIWIKRYKWAPIKSRKIVYTPPVGRPPIAKR
ncbi:cytochrome c1, heme protein, mitochondrial [Paracoccidioides brasiliensis Pb18]|uniref:quinol--cytochrome-c reductase n=1 Tax=Paracoccidioides brasiliensis (strain Pb18) TaxID=502780 RepID=A0A0A0HTA9_PARBD|nr:cytochrome c1, heme protein, mitochondrial [Paracoccidioides brasiliensis Pb18]KGM91543.1 cytochrome c1, heme protein, mitochondrial [Paracoccidioides brasiliensis Pb18]